MFCQNCGNRLNNGAKFCSFCGQKIIIPPNIEHKTPAIAQPNKPNDFNAAQNKNIQVKQQKKREPIPGWRILLGIIGCILATFGFMSMLGGAGLFIGVFLVFIPFIVFVIVYNATIK